MSGFLSTVKQLFRKSNTTKPSASVDTCSAGQSSVTLPALAPEEINQAFYALLFPVTTGSSTITVPQKRAINAVADNLKKNGAHLPSIPRLPSIIPRLLKTLRDPDASANDLVGIINKDPVMSTAVLKLANSAFFNPYGQPITSMEQGVVKLGLQGLRSVLSATVMQPVIQYKSPYFSDFGRTLWEHSLCCAVTCEVIAKQQGLESFKAYLLGLVHDMGKLTIFSELCGQFKLNPGDEAPDAQTFASLIQTMSAELSYKITVNWELPEEICTALKQQHSCGNEKDMGEYGRLLFQANLVCEAYASRQQGEDEHNRVTDEDYQNLLSRFSIPASLSEKLSQLSL